MQEPFVSVLVVVRNEADFIDECLTRLENQDYPPDAYEILVVDGRSEDGTREIAARHAARDPRIKVLDNPLRRYSSGLNIGIRHARGQFIIKVDGHSFVSPGFIRQSVETALRTRADVCGGRIITRGAGDPISESIALVLSSPFGIGNARFRYGGKAGWVDTVPYGCYRREVFERIGCFDESRDRTEDLDLHARLLRAGGRIYYNPEITSVYMSRRTVREFSVQAFRNGFEIGRSLSVARPRHVVPLFFVVYLMSAFLPLGGPWRIAWWMGVGTYCGVNLLMSLMAVWRARSTWRCLPLLPPLFLLLHLSYGVGSLVSAAIGIGQFPRNVLRWFPPRT